MIDLNIFYENPIKFQNVNQDVFRSHENPLSQLVAIQCMINRAVLNNVALHFVYKIKDEENIKSLKKTRNKFKNGDLYDLSNLKISDTIVFKNISKIRSAFRGYHTYGDHEDFLAVQLAPIMEYEQFERVTMNAVSDIENIQKRKGLVNVWQERMKSEYEELEEIGICT